MLLKSQFEPVNNYTQLCCANKNVQPEEMQYFCLIFNWKLKNNLGQKKQHALHNRVRERVTRTFNLQMQCSSKPFHTKPAGPEQKRLNEQDRTTADTAGKKKSSELKLN